MATHYKFTIVDDEPAYEEREQAHRQVKNTDNADNTYIDDKKKKTFAQFSNPFMLNSTATYRQSIFCTRS
jgi:hypothetical protein